MQIAAFHHMRTEKHKHYKICSNCGQTPIIDVIYECVICLRFVLCEICEEIVDHPHCLIMKYDKDKISPSWEEVFEIITTKAKPVSLPKLKINRDTVANGPKTSVQRRMAI